jgi:hypothetical protein
MEEERKKKKKKKAIQLATFCPLLHFRTIPSSKLLASDSLRGSNSHISEAKNSEPS